MRYTKSRTFHRLPTTLLLMAVAVSGGCADRLLAPGDELLGRWGGDHIEFVAEADGVMIRMACAWANVPGPFTLGSVRDFEGTGLLYRSSHIGEPLNLRFGGRLVPGGGLRLTLVFNEEQPVAYFLRLGRRADLSTICVD
jgi:hypothetical protein